MSCYIDPERKRSQGWRSIGGKEFYFRSKWEANYARYLQFLKENKSIKDWDHECETFWFKDIKRGVCSYLPDFRVLELDGSHYWAEVKGWLDPRSKTKIKRFSKYYPEEKLSVVDKSWFSRNNSQMRALINDWE